MRSISLKVVVLVLVVVLLLVVTHYKSVNIRTMKSNRWLILNADFIMVYTIFRCV